MQPKKPRLASVAPVSLTPRARSAAPPRAEAEAKLKEALGTFRGECDAAMDALRAALRQLSAAASSDPLRPQDVSRAFAINKNLTWKIARVLLAGDSLEAIGMLPGAEGIEIYLRAFDAAGTKSSFADAVREAVRRLDAVITRHFGDRAQFEVVLDGLRSGGTLESSRRMAFRGMAGVFGVQARARLTAQILIPSTEDPARADIALIVGLSGIQRLRPMGALPMFRTANTTSSARPGPVPFMTAAGASEPNYLVEDYSSYADGTIKTQSTADGRFTIELSEGPLGRAGQSDLFFATLTRHLMDTRPSAGDARCSFVTSVSVPSEAFASDLFIHRSIGGLESLRTSIHSTLSQPLTEDERQRRVSMLPLDATPIIVDELAAGFGLAGVERYEAMIGRAFETLGQDPREYRLVRVAMAYPAVPSALLVEWNLVD